MKVKIFKDTVGGGKRLSAGKTCDLPDDDARILIRMGRAEMVMSKAEKKAVTNTEREARAKASGQPLAGGNGTADKPDGTDDNTDNTDNTGDVDDGDATETET